MAWWLGSKFRIGQTCLITHYVCDLGRVTLSFCAFVSLAVRRGKPECVPRGLFKWGVLNATGTLIQRVPKGNCLLSPLWLHGRTQRKPTLCTQVSRWTPFTVHVPFHIHLTSSPSTSILAPAIPLPRMSFPSGHSMQILPGFLDAYASTSRKPSPIQK